MQHELHVAHNDVSCSVGADGLEIVPRTNRKKDHVILYIVITRVFSRRGVWWPKRKYVVLPGNILFLL